MTLEDRLRRLEVLLNILCSACRAHDNGEREKTIKQAIAEIEELYTHPNKDTV